MAEGDERSIPPPVTSVGGIAPNSFVDQRRVPERLRLAQHQRPTGPCIRCTCRSRSLETSLAPRGMTGGFRTLRSGPRSFLPVGPDLSRHPTARRRRARQLRHCRGPLRRHREERPHGPGDRFRVGRLGICRTMMMTWVVSATDTGTLVKFIADDVPVGFSRGPRGRNHHRWRTSPRLWTRRSRSSGDSSPAFRRQRFFFFFKKKKKKKKKTPPPPQKIPYSEVVERTTRLVHGFDERVHAASATAGPIRLLARGGPRATSSRTYERPVRVRGRADRRRATSTMSSSPAGTTPRNGFLGALPSADLTPRSSPVRAIARRAVDQSTYCDRRSGPHVGSRPSGWR